MTRRTEERLEVAKAKENLWRKFRERKETRDGEGGRGSMEVTQK